MRRTEIKLITNGSNSYELKTNVPLSKSSHDTKHEKVSSYDKIFPQSKSNANVNR